MYFALSHSSFSFFYVQKYPKKYFENIVRTFKYYILYYDFLFFFIFASLVLCLNFVCTLHRFVSFRKIVKNVLVTPANAFIHVIFPLSSKVNCEI